MKEILKHQHGGHENEFLEPKKNLISPDETQLEAKFAEIESKYVEDGLPDTVSKGFVDRFRRIVGLEFLSRQPKPIHRKIMNHHIMLTITRQMSLMRKYPDVRMANLHHFSGTWQNTLSFLVAFNRTNYGCLNQRARVDNLNGKFVEYDNDPTCYDVPKMTSELDFELSKSEAEDDSEKLIYFVRVIYNGESIGLCVDNQAEYKKPMSERIFKIYCPLDDFLLLMRQ